MEKFQAQEFIRFLAKIWKIKEKKFFLEITELLDKNVNRKLSLFNGFEFSLVEGNRSLRLLHLDFWKSNCSFFLIKKNLQKRKEIIKTIFQKVSKKFHLDYNFSLLNSFFQFNEETCLWPLQFGIEYKEPKVRLKIYLSINGDSFPLKKFCQKFILNFQMLNNKLNNVKFDSVAIDFFSKGNYQFKFYPFLKTNKDKGFLLRINKKSQVISKKIWIRFPNGLLIDEKINNFLHLPRKILNYMKTNNFKIYYFCKENNKKSIYFR